MTRAGNFALGRGPGSGIEALEPDDPNRVGPYRLLGRLGVGGMGRVYLASSAGWLVAVKLVHGEYAAHPRFRARFRHEIRAAGQVSGAFTAAVVEADPEAERPWLAVRYIPALSVSEAVRHFGPVTDPSTLKVWGAAVSEALRAIHSAGLVHRDLKPSNVLVTAEGPLVIDFGIAKALEGTRLTRTGSLTGTVGYMSPEQLASSREVGPPSDVFSLGALLTFLAAGSSPFGAGDAHQISRRVVEGEPELNHVPEGVRPLITSCLAKAAVDRPTTEALIGSFGPATVESLISPDLAEALRMRAEEATSLRSEPLRKRPPSPSLLRIEPVPVGPAPPRSDRGGTSRLTRRRMLMLVGGGVGALALTGTALVLDDVFSSRAVAGAAGGKPTTGWTPVWTASVGSASSIASGTASPSGGTLLLAGMFGTYTFDTTAGSRLWSSSDQAQATPGPIPSGGSLIEPCGVIGALYYYWGLTQSGANALFVLSPTGHVLSSVTVATDGIGLSLCGISGSKGVFAQITGSANAVTAIDLTSGATMWTYALEHSIMHQDAVSTYVVTDATRCYIQDGPDTTALNLDSGAISWHSAGTAEAGLPTNLVLAGNVLLVGSMHVTALDLVIGRQIWTSAVNWPPDGSPGENGPNYLSDFTSTYVNMLSVVESTAYFADGSNAVWALDVASGARKWTYTNNELQLNAGGDFQPILGFASADLVAVPYINEAGINGFITLDPVTGAESGLYTPPYATEDSGPWQLVVSGNEIYAFNDYTLVKFEGPST